MTVNQVLDELRHVLDSSVDPVHGPPRPAEVRHSFADISRSCSALGWEPCVNLRDGLRRTIEHFESDARRGGVLSADCRQNLNDRVRAPMTDRSRPAELTLGVVVPATDAAPFLDRCLSSIAAAADGPDEVIVVDEPELSVVEARNRGAWLSSADVLVFIDSDVLIHADSFTRIRAAFVADPKLSALIGAYDERPSARGTVSGFRNLLHHSVSVSAPGPVATFWTGLGAVLRDALSRSGDSTTRCDGRAPAAIGATSWRTYRWASGSLMPGHRIVLDPQIQGTHLKHWTLSQMVYTDFLLRACPGFGCSCGGPCPRAPEPRLASPDQRAGEPARRSGACQAATRLDGRDSDDARGAQPPVLSAAATSPRTVRGHGRRRRARNPPPHFTREPIRRRGDPPGRAPQAIVARRQRSPASKGRSRNRRRAATRSASRCAAARLMLATFGGASLTIIASLALGAGISAACGRPEPTWLAGGVGFAALIVAATGPCGCRAGR